MERPLRKLLTLLTHVTDGTIAIAIYDHPSVLRRVLDVLRERSPGRVLELRVDGEHRNPVDLMRSVDRRHGDVFCVLNLEKGFPESLGYLDLQREVLLEFRAPIVLWVTPSEHLELVKKAPNLYRFRKTLLDFRESGRRSRSDSSPIPTVFISSTVEDLRLYREAARDAAIGAGFLPVMLEYFTASGARPPLDECLDRVSQAHVVVVIVAHRYGWVPPDQPRDPDQISDQKKNITWLECKRAESDGKEILAFVVDDKRSWPEEQREEHDLTVAMREGKATPDLFESVKGRLARLREFKQWLDGRGIRAQFTTPEDLRGRVSDALRDWRSRHLDAVRTSGDEPAMPADPTRYLKSLLEQTAYIDIRGLQVGTGKAFRFPIEDLYITLSTSASPEAPGKEPDRSKGERSEMDPLAARGESSIALHKALAQRRLVVIGDPGSGKTTFLRRVASTLCQTALGEVPDAAKSRLGLASRPFPIFVRLVELAEHVAETRRSRGAPRPATSDAAGWLPHFLAAASEGVSWGLDEGFFRRRLESGECALLLDGLDEVPDRISRGALSRLIENVSLAYKDCIIAVTSRPAAYTGEAVLPGFAHARIEPLEDDAIRTFLGKWSGALHPESAHEAERHRDELVGALVSRLDIRRMARNPVMLTALAVVHWNEKRLPEQRADLYESIIRWLSRSREQRAGRLPADRCVAVLQELALAMQDHPQGRQVQVPRHWAAEAIAREFAGEATGHRIAPPESVREATRYAIEKAEPEHEATRHSIELAERFLEEEEIDSGIVVGRGNEIRFWHLTFQEYLAARAIAGRSETMQKRLLFKERGKIHLPDWREVILLLTGVLHQQGRQKVDGFVSEALEVLGKEPRLPEQARCAGLLGAVLRDLSPLEYRISDARYERLLDRVLGIFDPRRSESVSIVERIEAADALGQAGDPRLDPSDPARWISIPAGTFRMGAQKEDSSKPNYDPDTFEWEVPVRDIYLDAYRIGRYPVTVAEYRLFVEHGGYEDEKCWKEGGFSKYTEPKDWEDQLSHPNRPVVGLSWYEATAYAAWAGCRLPTEAQWERAARGRDGRKYPWGPEPPNPSRANYSETKVGHPTPVGLFPLGATPEGVHDLAGNVWEWCHDWWGERYIKSQTKNPAGPDDGTSRVLRGGSWYDGSGYMRSAYRDGYDPVGRDGHVGFRVVLLVGVRTP